MINIIWQTSDHIIELGPRHMCKVKFVERHLLRSWSLQRLTVSRQLAKNDLTIQGC